MFVRFLELNNLLIKKTRERLIAENTLVAIALMVAQSDPIEKELMVNLVVSLLVEN